MTPFKAHYDGMVDTSRSNIFMHENSAKFEQTPMLLVVNQLLYLPYNVNVAIESILLEGVSSCSFEDH
jgi:hypothetical protein